MVCDELQDELAVRGDGKISLLQKVFSPPIFRSSVFRTKCFVGWEKNRMEPFFMDCKQSFRESIVGAPGCMPLDTKIMTPSGLRALQDLEDIDQVYSFNIEKNYVEIDTATKILSGKKDLVEIETELGIVRCSPDHVFFISNEGKVTTKKASELTKEDNLIKIDE